MSARRAASLLRVIPEGQKKQIIIRWVRPTGRESNAVFSKHEAYGEFVDLHLDLNVAAFLAGPQVGAAKLPVHLPLDWIETVWRDPTNNVWVVFTRAVLEPVSGQYQATLVS